MKKPKSCPHCGGCGYYEVESSYGIELVECECQRKQTNEEWLCQLTTEEKAKWIAEEKMCRGYFIFPSMEEAIQDALEWLKQPHTVKERQDEND